MSQYTIVNNEGKFVFGWDRPLNSFFFQRHILDFKDDDCIIVWLGATADTRLPDVSDLVVAALNNGLGIPSDIIRELHLDKSKES